MEEQKKERKFRELNPDVWIPEKEGDAIEGFLIKLEPAKPELELSAKYFISTEGEQGIKMVWGCKILDDRIGLTKLGKFVRIIYDGTATNQRGREYKKYRVFEEE